MESVEVTLGAHGNVDELRRSILNTLAGHAIDHPGATVDYARVFPQYLERVKQAYFGERHKQVRELAEDILLFLGDAEAHGLDKARITQARETIERLEQRYAYRAESIKDALGELLARRYQG
jgi:hypothetical protein